MAADAIEEGRLRNVNVGLLGHVDSGYGSVLAWEECGWEVWVGWVGCVSLFE